MRPLVYSLTDKMPFGKYKGHSIKTIIYKDDGYFFWMISKEVLSFSQEVFEYYSEVMRKYKPNIKFHEKVYHEYAETDYLFDMYALGKDW